MSGHGVRQIAGRGAADRGEPDRGGGIDRCGTRTVLERQRRVAHRVVLHPDAGDAEATRQSRSLEQRREAAVERQHGLTVERQPFAIAPQRGRARGNGLAVGQSPPGLVHRVERPETLLADRDGASRALGAAVATAEGTGRERRSSRDRRGGRCDRDLKKKKPGNERRGRSLFSTLFNVAAIRGKSPRKQLSLVI